MDQRKLSLTFCAIMAALGTTTPASAQWLHAYGKIVSSVSSYATNYAFRILLQKNGVDQLPNCNNSFAFLNTDDSNYQVKVASLLTAAAQGNSVSISFTKDGAGWCSISDVTVIF